MDNINEDENQARMLSGDLYYAFLPGLITKRKRCLYACQKYNQAGEVSRRELVKLWRDVVNDPSPLPVPATTEEADELLFRDEVMVNSPVMVDYGTNLKIGKGVYINFNCTFLDVCLITIGSRTLIGPNCSFFSASHPLDPFLRNGIDGPEFGAPINVGEDCWFGGNVVVCPGVTIGRGVTVGAGSVVTKDIPPFHVVAGNPARIIRKIEPKESDPLPPFATRDETLASTQGVS